MADTSTEPCLLFLYCLNLIDHCIAQLSSCLAAFRVQATTASMDVGKQERDLSGIFIILANDSQEQFTSQQILRNFHFCETLTDKSRLVDSLITSIALSMQPVGCTLYRCEQQQQLVEALLTSYVSLVASRWSECRLRQHTRF